MGKYFFMFSFWLCTLSHGWCNTRMGNDSLTWIVRATSPTYDQRNTATFCVTSSPCYIKGRAWFFGKGLLFFTLLPLGRNPFALCSPLPVSRRTWLKNTPATWDLIPLSHVCNSVLQTSANNIGYYCPKTQTSINPHVQFYAITRGPTHNWWFYLTAVTNPDNKFSAIQLILIIRFFSYYSFSKSGIGWYGAL